MITKLDRLGRSLEHLIALSKQLQAKGVDLVVLDQARDGAPAKRPYLAVSSSLRNSTGTAQLRTRHPVRAGTYRDFSFRCSPRVVSSTRSPPMSDSTRSTKPMVQ